MMKFGKMKHFVVTLVCAGVVTMASAISVFAFTGKGTQESPYLINSRNEMEDLASDVNGGASYSGKYFELTADLDLSDGNWTPIGDGTNHFAGYFDGGNHTIKNMTVDSAGVAGLFGSVSTGAQIGHLTLEGGSVTTTGVSAGGFVGKMVGSGSGKIVVYDCVNESCDVSGSTTGCTGGVGGVVGRLEVSGVKTFAIVEYCKNYADVYASDENAKYVGGIAGSSVGDIDYPTIIRACINEGKIGYSGSTAVSGGSQGTGGVVGGTLYRSLVYNCANYGSVYGTVSATVGGICGRSIGQTTYVYKCYNEGAVSGSSYCGGISGRSTAGLISNYSAAKPGGSYPGWIVGSYMQGLGRSIGYCYYNSSSADTIAYNNSGTTYTKITSNNNSGNNITNCGYGTFANSVSGLNKGSMGSVQFTTYASNFDTSVSKLFVKNTITLNFNNDGETTSVSVSEGDNYSLTTPTKTGYTFAGWYTTPTDGMHRITSDDVVALSHENTEGRTLYARWTADSAASTHPTKSDAANLLKELAKNGTIAYNSDYDEDNDNVLSMKDIIGILKET